MAIFVATIFITIGNMVGQVWLNDWNGQFFRSIDQDQFASPFGSGK
jgi:hypothetical protein